MAIIEFIAYSLNLKRSYKKVTSNGFRLSKTTSPYTNHPAPFKSKSNVRIDSVSQASIKPKVQIERSGAGFTLIEYLVAIAILATLVGGVIFTLDPFSQIGKGQDAQRRQDIQQIKNALETYYQDTSCYPTVDSEFTEALESTTDREWRSGDTVYMSEIPQDATCSEFDGYCYQYVSDTETDCPQWNVVFAKLSQPPAQSTTICPLSDLTDTCTPEGYDDTWACVMSGAVNCQLLAVSGFGYDSGSGAGGEATPTPTGTQEIILSDDAFPTTIGTEDVDNTNPYPYYLIVDPQNADPDTEQTFLVDVEDSSYDVERVLIHLFSDNNSPQILDLRLISGTLRDGRWGITTLADTYNERFYMAIVAENANGVQRCGVVPVPGFSDSAPGADAICDDINL